MITIENFEEPVKINFPILYPITTSSWDYYLICGRADTEDFKEDIDCGRGDTEDFKSIIFCGNAFSGSSVNITFINSKTYEEYIFEVDPIVATKFNILVEILFPDTIERGQYYVKIENSGRVICRDIIQLGTLKPNYKKYKKYVR